MSKETGRIQLFYNSERDLNIPMLYSYLDKSYKESQIETIILIFYIRDCREGKGERLLGRKALGWLFLKDYKTFSKIYTLVPLYGRWDDLVYFWPGVLFPHNEPIKFIKNNFNIKINENDLKEIKKIQKEILLYFGQQLIKDRELHLVGKQPSRLAKWAPTENCKIDRSRNVVSTLCKAMGWSKKEYRKNYLSPLRDYLQIVERYLCDNKVHDLDFDNIPVNALKKYRKKLRDVSPAKYYTRKIFIIEPNNPYPYQIVRDIRKTGGFFPPIWKSIGKKLKTIKDCLCILDNSPSTNSWYIDDGKDFLPSDIIYSMCLIISENHSRNFKDTLITFSTNPTLEKIPKGTLENKYKHLKLLPWGFVLDIEKVYDLFLTSPKKIPKKFLIISDKKIEDGIINISSLKSIKKKFDELDLFFPNILYWNLNYDQVKYPTVTTKNNIEIITGFSDHVIDALLEGRNFEPLYPVQKVVFSDRYFKIGDLLA